MEDLDGLLSKEHYYGIGKVTVQWAALESSLMFVIASLLQMDISDAVITFWHMGYNDRRDRLINLVELANALTEEEKKEFECLIVRLNAGYKMRNTVAHSIWSKSDKPHAIKPHVVVARGGKIKLSGFNLAEEHFTPQRLEDEAQKIGRLGQDFLHFAVQRFGYAIGLGPEEPVLSE